MIMMMSTQNVDLDENSLYHYLVIMTPEQCRAARAWLNWPQDALAKAANVGVSTVRDFEAARREPTRNNLTAMKVALETGGISFVNDGDHLGIAAARRP
jgi:DNA-binding transcriptional regulator YiaG